MPATFQAGDLIHRVEIQRLQYPPEVDESGAHKDVWETLATRRAHVRDANGREIWQGRQQEAEVDVTVKLYYVAELAAWGTLKEGPKMRFLDKNHGNRVLNIKVVQNPDGQKIEHVVLCKA